MAQKQSLHPGTFLRAFLLPFFVVNFISCKDKPVDTFNDISGNQAEWISREYYSLDSIPDSNLGELKPCDIIVKPNVNWLPGTSGVPDGFGFGHAAIVINGFESDDEEYLLTRVLTFESQARDVAPEFQVRLVPAYLPGDDYSYANYNFSPSNLGRYYRLRPDISDVQRKAVIDYLLAHDQDLSSPRSWKNFAGDLNGEVENKGDKVEYWYCSLLIWQAFYDVLGIDLDANQGLYVYPNDLVNSSYFDDEPGKPSKRIRF